MSAGYKMGGESPVSARVGRLLMSAGYYSLESLDGVEGAQLLRIKGFGRAALLEVVEAMKRGGYTLNLGVKMSEEQTAAGGRKFPRLLAGVDSRTGETVISMCDAEYSGEVLLGLDFSEAGDMLAEVGLTEAEGVDYLADLLAKSLVYVKYANVKVFNREGC